MRTEEKQRLRQLRHWRIRKKVFGTAERPRMSVCFSDQHIRVQFIDDVNRVTLAAADTLGGPAPEGMKLGANVASATVIGKLAGEAAKAKGITEVVFDRGGTRYHGKIKALADAARAVGIKF